LSLLVRLRSAPSRRSATGCRRSAGRTAAPARGPGCRTCLRPRCRSPTGGHRGQPRAVDRPGVGIGHVTRLQAIPSQCSTSAEWPSRADGPGVVTAERGDRVSTSRSAPISPGRPTRHEAPFQCAICGLDARYPLTMRPTAQHRPARLATASTCPDRSAPRTAARRAVPVREAELPSARLRVAEAADRPADSRREAALHPSAGCADNRRGVRGCLR